MKYTIQLHTESGSWACPSGTDVKHVLSKREAAELLLDWADTVGRYEDARCVSALVWKGFHNDTTDLYPDFKLVLGPRMGVNWEYA